jgi:serine/threonine-protein kinase ULK/ATG1
MKSRGGFLKEQEARLLLQ